MSKKSKALGLHEPLRLQDHPRPRTRREFLAQSFMTGAATVIAPTLAGMLAYPRAARATLAPRYPKRVATCNITTGAGKIPFICFDLAGGGNIAGSNVLVGGPKGQLDFLSVAGYSKLGLARLHGAERQRHRQFRRRELRPALSLGQRASARHEAARQRQGDGGHERHHHSRAVAERHQHQSAQSHVRHLSVRRARRIAQSDRLGELACPAAIPCRRRPWSLRPRMPTKISSSRGQPGPGQHRTAQHPVAAIRPTSPMCWNP